MSAKEINELIKDLRTDRDMNRKDVAKYVGISEATLSRIENKKRSITVEELMKFAEIFNVTPQFLLGLNSNKGECADIFLQKLVKQFGITTTEDYYNEGNGVFTPDDFVFSMSGDYLVLTAKEEFFELFEYLAVEAGVKSKRPPKEYKRLINNAIKRFEKSTKSNKKCKYFFVSKEQMEKLIDERAKLQRKTEDALKKVEKLTNTDYLEPEETT